MIPDPRVEPTIDTDRAAELLGCSGRTLYGLARTNSAPVEPLRLGRNLRWPTAKLLELVGLAPERDTEPGPIPDSVVIDFPVTGTAQGVSGGA